MAINFIGDYYNRKELKLLFQAVKGKRIEFAIIMAAYYGLRRSEILGLKWNAVDFYYDTITINHTVSDCSIDGKFTRIAKDRTKSQKSIRTLPLVNSVKEILIKMKEAEKLNILNFGNGYKNEYEGYVYKDDIGDLVKPGFVTQNFSQMCEKAGLKHIRFHDLRHTAATNMHELTGDFYTVGQVLGHSLKGIGIQLQLSNNLEAVTAQYVDVRLERKLIVLDRYHKEVMGEAKE